MPTNQPAVTVTRGVARDVDQIGTYVPVPGLGVLPVNAFVLHAAEPMLIDTGVTALAEETLSAIRETVDLASLRYVYLTHTDPDHVGCLRQLLEEAPRARLVTTYLGLGKLGLARPVSPERVLLLNPGQHLALGDREVVVGRPPTYDAPETTWLCDMRGDVLFSSDCFGAVVSRSFRTAEEVPDAELRDGLITWAGLDSPWFFEQDPAKRYNRLRALTLPHTVLSAHLPPARGMSEVLLQHLSRASEAEPPAWPDQSALHALLASA